MHLCCVRALVETTCVAQYNHRSRRLHTNNNMHMHVCRMYVCYFGSFRWHVCEFDNLDFMCAFVMFSWHVSMFFNNSIYFGLYDHINIQKPIPRRDCAMHAILHSAFHNCCRTAATLSFSVQNVSQNSVHCVWNWIFPLHPCLHGTTIRNPDKRKWRDLAMTTASRQNIYIATIVQHCHNMLRLDIRKQRIFIA